MKRNDVLVIGAGPSGLFAASELARHGVSVRLIEREMQPHPAGTRHGNPAGYP